MEVLGNILLIIVSICTFISYFPQIIKCLRTKKSEDLSVWSWALWVTSSLAYTLYACLCQDSIMLIVETLLESIFCLIILACAIIFRKNGKEDLKVKENEEKINKNEEKLIKMKKKTIKTKKKLINNCKLSFLKN